MSDSKFNIGLISGLCPNGTAGFPLLQDKDVLMKDGKRLSEWVSAQDYLKEIEKVIMPEMFSGESDDDKVKKAISYCIEQKAAGIRCRLYMPGVYTITETVNMRGIDLDIPGTIILANGKTLEVGSSSVTSMPCYIKINYIKYADLSYKTELDADGIITAPTVKIIGLSNGKVELGLIPSIQLWADGTVANDTDAYIAYSDFSIGACEYLQITDKAGSNGWINENSFYGCRVTKEFSIIGNSHAHGNNVFYKPCFENAKVTLKNCYFNKFYDVRNESLDFSSTPDITEQFTLDLDENTSFNYIELGYGYCYFLTDSQLHVNNKGKNNTIIFAGLSALQSVPFYSLNYNTFTKKLYTVYSDTENIEDTVTTIENSTNVLSTQAGKSILNEAIIPVDGIEYIIGSVAPPACWPEPADDGIRQFKQKTRYNISNGINNKIISDIIDLTEAELDQIENDIDSYVDNDTTFIWVVTALDKNKKQFTDPNNKLQLRGVGTSPNYPNGIGKADNYAYSHNVRSNEFTLAILDKNVKYLAITIKCIGSGIKLGAKGGTYWPNTPRLFRGVSMSAYYDPRNTYTATELADYLKPGLA